MPQLVFSVIAIFSRRY